MLTLTIAIIGAITGVLALMLQYIEYKKSKVKLEVNLNDRKSFYTTGDNRYKCKYFGVISIKISNCSSLPITIDEAEIKYNKISHEYFNNEIKVDKEHNNNDRSYTEIQLFNQPKLPFRIDCYDTAFLSFIFPFFDEITNNKFEFILKTPRKEYKSKFKINEFEEIFKNY